MSQKVSIARPSYQLQKSAEAERVSSNDFHFRHEDTDFLCRIPLLGMTETQKETMRYFAGKAPVISISHKKPEWSEHNFRPTENLNYNFSAYAEVVATVQLMGEETARQVKIYFGNYVLHVENKQTRMHKEGKGVHVVEL